MWMIHGSFGKIITRRGGGRLLGLLLRALHARPPLLVLVLLLLPPRLRRSPPVLLLDIYILHVALLRVHVHVELLRPREVHGELDEHAPLREGPAAVLRHPLVLDHLHLARRDHLARLAAHRERAAVQLPDVELEAAERLEQRDLLAHHEVVALALEHAVLLLREGEDDVPRHDPRRLVRLAPEDDLVLRGHPLLDDRLQDLLLLDHLPPGTIPGASSAS